MDVTEAIETRLEIREYADEPVDEETKREILEAGRLASSGSNRQHWRFLLLDDDEEIERLADLSPSGSWVAGADFVVVILTESDYRPNDLDAGRALTYMQLAAWDAGVVSCIYTVYNSDVYEFLEVPEEYEISTVVGFGYPTFDIDDVEGIKDREPLGDLVYRGKFGDPL